MPARLKLERPNILWIVTTQWRAQACGFAGDPNARTPCLDALAAQSVNYAQAVTPHPFGPFARAALLTGVPSPQNGVRDYFDSLPVWRTVDPGGHRPPLQGGASPASRLLHGRTIAHEMKERGYATAFFGKWHLGKRDPRAPLVGEAHARMIVPPEARGGFEFWEGFESGFLLNDPWLHGSRLERAARFKGYQSDVVVERAACWLGGQFPDAKSQTPNSDSPTQDPGPKTRNSAAERRPWFAVVSFEAPHPPYDAPAGGIEARDPGEIMLPANVPRGGEAEVKARRELAGYYAHIEATDRALGRLIADVDAAAARCGRRAPIVVFTSVHGDMHGAHGLFRKGWPHEESVRVPLLVRLPGHESSSQFGVRSLELVSLLDFPRWTMAWAEGDPSAVIDRRYSSISMPSIVALPHQCDRAWRGVRTQTHKLVLNDDGSPWLFFDLEHDPLERRNLVGDAGRPADIGELTALIDQ